MTWRIYARPAVAGNGVGLHYSGFWLSQGVTVGQFQIFTGRRRAQIWQNGWRIREVGLALATITTVDAANSYLRETYILAHNLRFAVKTEQEGSAFVMIPGVDLNEILCLQDERVVGNDNTVAFRRLRLQIPPSPLRPHFVKSRVKVRQYHNGTYAIFHGPRCLGRYDQNGLLQSAELEAAA